MTLKPGSRWQSTVCDTQAVLVRPPKEAGGAVPQCGGADMVPFGAASGVSGAPAAGFDGGSLVGKRYRQEASGIEMLCTKAGTGSLGWGGAALELVATKQLPSSD